MLSGKGSSFFLFLPFAIPFRRRGSDTPKRVKFDYRR
nr:MAG TPA: hypothetical protein [Caudoviricetes sp.]